MNTSRPVVAKQHSTTPIDYTKSYHAQCALFRNSLGGEAGAGAFLSSRERVIARLAMVDGSDQLRFNVHVAPDPARMATSYKMRPGPVIIEQLPTRGRHVESLPERMEIASKLARRQLEHIMLRWAATRDTVTQSRGPLDQQQPQQRHSPPDQFCFN